MIFVCMIQLRGERKPMAIRVPPTEKRYADAWLWLSERDYAQGELEPRYPMPVVLPTRTPETRDDVRAARRFFVSPDGSGGINWDWAYFLTESDAIGFDTWCSRNGYETRGVYPPHRDCYYGVRYR